MEWVHYVLEVARCGGIARAARNLFITPSALSKFIILKEAELGVRLFNREGNKFTLTYPGERYVEMLREEARLREEIRSEMARLADLYSGRLRVGFQMSFAETMTGRVLPILQDEYPNIHIFMEEAGTDELIKMLKKNQLDIALTLTDEKDDDLQYDTILASPVVLAAAKGSPLLEKSEQRPGFSHSWLSADALCDESVVFDRGGRSFRKYGSVLTGPGKNAMRSNITVTNARTALLCVEQDMGIIVLPEILIRELHFEDRVEMYSFGPEEREVMLYAVSNSKSVLINEIQTFSTVLRELYHQPKC